MGVFTVGRQVALEIDMPGWWLSGASVDMNFTRGLYYDSSTANPQAATNFLSCSRASIGYAKTSTGTLTQFATNALRITDLGLLVEDARTNNTVSSQALTATGGTGWVPFGSLTITDNNTAAPDGTTTAARVVGAVSGYSEINNGNPTTVASTTTKYTISVYAKRVDLDFVLLLFADGTGQSFGSWFNLNTGTLGTSFTQGDCVTDSRSIETLANGWFRLVVTGHQGVNHGVGFKLDILPCRAIEDVNNTATGTQYFWGGQFEQGDFPSSYIPTTGAAATRAADSITCAGNLNTTLIGSSGSALIDFQQAGVRTDSFVGLIEEASISTNRIFGSDNVPAINSQSASDTISVAPINILTGCKAASGWSGAGRTLAVDNQTVQTSAVALAAATTQKLGSGFGHGGVFAYFRRLTAYNSRLADVTLRALTAP